MKTIKIAILGASLCLSFLFTGGLTASAANVTGAQEDQVVHKTKHYSKKTYHKGRWVTKTTWRHGKRYTKRVWYTGDNWGHKVGHKSKEVVMGTKKKMP